MAAKIQKWKLLLLHTGKRLSSLDPRTKLIQRKQQLKTWQQAFDRSILSLLTLNKQKFQGINHTLKVIDPRHLLTKGYSVLFGEDGTVITDAAKVHTGDKVNIRLAKGSLKATIDEALR